VLGTLSNTKEVKFFQFINLVCLNHQWDWNSLRICTRCDSRSFEDCHQCQSIYQRWFGGNLT
jgi:hypothetical protein